MAYLNTLCVYTACLNKAYCMSPNSFMYKMYINTNLYPPVVRRSGQAVGGLSILPPSPTPPPIPPPLLLFPQGAS